MHAHTQTKEDGIVTRCYLGQTGLQNTETQDTNEGKHNGTVEGKKKSTKTDTLCQCLLKCTILDLLLLQWNK